MNCEWQIRKYDQSGSNWAQWYLDVVNSWPTYLSCLKTRFFGFPGSYKVSCYAVVVVVGSHWVALLIYCQALLAPHTWYWVCGKGNKKELQFVKYPNDINRSQIFLLFYHFFTLSGFSEFSKFSLFQVYEAPLSCDRCTSDINTNKIPFPCFQFYILSFYQVSGQQEPNISTLL